MAGPQPIEQVDSDWESDCPLFMNKLPSNPEENETLSAINTLMYVESTPEERAESFNEQGSEAFKRGTPDSLKAALQFYTRAIDEKGEGIKRRHVYLCNRAAVNLRLGNYGKARLDADQVISLDPSNIKAYWRASKASFAVKKFAQAVEYAEKGLVVAPGNAALQAELARASKELAKKLEEERLIKEKEDERLRKRGALVQAIDARGIKMGAPLFKRDEGRTGIVTISPEGDLSWPVLFLYPEFNQSDYVSQMHELDCLAEHMLIMFGQPAPWDPEHLYNPASVRIWYSTNQTRLVPTDKALPDKGTEPKAKFKQSWSAKSPRWKEVSSKLTLLQALLLPDHIVPYMPTFYITIENSFEKTWLSTPLE